MAGGFLEEKPVTLQCPCVARHPARYTRKSLGTILATDCWAISVWWIFLNKLDNLFLWPILCGLTKELYRGTKISFVRQVTYLTAILGAVRTKFKGSNVKITNMPRSMI